MSSNNKDILRIALPSIVSNITVPLLGLIDVGITGHLGKTAYLGAIAVGGMLFNVLYWMFAFLRMGSLVVIKTALLANKLRNCILYALNFFYCFVIHCTTPAIYSSSL